METSFEGQRFVPKSINIIRNDFSQFRAVGKLSFKSSRFISSNADRTFHVTKPTALTGQARPSFEERLSEVANGMNPIRTIVPFAGAQGTISVGWELCDGRPVLRVGRYRRLFAVLNTTWGGGDGNTTFNLPDLRGRFLRGVDSTPDDVKRDPDRNLRKNSDGKVVGNQVGSLQEDALQTHNHPISGRVLPDAKSWVGPAGSTFGTDGNISAKTEESPQKQSETRPENAYVYWIIRIE